jgi:cellulose biosynthesis protein BcsQ
MNLKGGVGKTVLAANMAREFVMRVKKKVLLVDLDPQCSLSHLLLTEEEFSDLPKQNTTYEALWSDLDDPVSLLKQDVRVVFLDRTSFFRQETGAQIDLLPGSMEIYNIIASAGASDSNFCIQSFRLFIAEARKLYDYVFIDTNPSTNIATLCALNVADYIISPITMDIFAARGVLMIRKLFSDRFRYLDDNAKVIGIWNMVDSKLRSSSRTSPAEEILFKKSPAAFELALANRIYDSGYLNYRGQRRGFVHDLPGISRIDYFNRTKRDFALVCEELFQRTGITDARSQ